ncbi:XdhC family protein [Pelotomaculum propionicicum]|uniref:XdhC family protein n=1 Tax=Pelotomaculum propionicicum TaxID=258475 RepID=UPI003B7B9383
MNIDLQQGKTIITVIRQEGLDESLPGAKIMLTADGLKINGDLRLPWLEEQAVQYVRENKSYGMFKVATLVNPAQPEQRATVMVDPYLAPPELIILGGGHIAVPLAYVGHMLGYQVTVVDDRPDFVSAERFAGIYKSICCDFNDIENILNLGPSSSVVIVTRGHMHDLDCLRRVIRYPIAYLGMIGSRRKIKMIKQVLLEDGIDMEKIEKVRMPIGLDIGAQTPAEIAVCIAAEMIMDRRGGGAGSLAEGRNLKVAHPNDCEMPSIADKEALYMAIIAALEKTPAALATITMTKGSTPRKAGARMLIYRDGRIQGTIGGGCGESEVRLQAMNVIDSGKPYLHGVSLTADIAASEGMACGGVMEVYIEPADMYAEVFDGGEEK